MALITLDVNPTTGAAIVVSDAITRLGKLE